ncbi:MAG: family 1 extracellular solute-binding protein [Paenibacillaceae bacterium]|jgi:putative aldouronate transport system substrate-binding protein|nr:family 1 extracellular solute-binding protein [Paenibacillaceae bacterium]
MKLKKWLAMPLAVMLAGGTVLAGCGNDKEEEGKAPPAAGQSAGASAKPAVKKDITVSIYDRGVVSQDEGTIENNRWTKWINENGPANVKFVAIPRTNPAEKINVLYASGSAPDLLFEYAPTNRNPLYDQKQLMPIDDLIEKHSVEYKKLLQENPMLKKAGTKSDGKLYEFGRISWVEPNRGILIRTDWLEKLKLEMPKTTDDLYKVVKAFAEQDPDGNGAKDTFGLVVSGNAEATIKQVFGATTSWVVKDGELVMDWDSRTDYFTFLKKLYDEGIIDRDFANDKNGAKAKQDFINGKVGIYPYLDGNSMSILQNLVDPLKKNVATANVTFLAYPQSKAGAFVPTLQNPVQMTAVVSATAKNPDAVIKYVDFLVKEDTMKTLTFGIEGTHYKMSDGVPEIIDAAKLKKEVSDISGDMRMLQNTGLTYGSSDVPLVKYKSDPRKEEYQKFYDLYRNTYLTLDKPYSELTVSEHMPALPKDLATIDTNAGKAIGDIWLKAVVSGEKYKVEQALKDAQDIWQKSNGKSIEDWYKNWYSTNKNDAFLAKDIFVVVKEQQEKYAKIMQEIK